ncbi:hypothetical protein [Frankia gtarii]|uniref:hypothetical protein n=1 Tax=Frankia gtarii TaxID=2950102 RepID=UPI0021C111CA|nr:hypothetical protein [Frankia gtarii]
MSWIVRKDPGLRFFAVRILEVTRIAAAVWTLVAVGIIERAAWRGGWESRLRGCERLADRWPTAGVARLIAASILTDQARPCRVVVQFGAAWVTRVRAGTGWCAFHLSGLGVRVLGAWAR